MKTLFDCVTFETVDSSSPTVEQCAQVYTFLTILSDKKNNAIFELMKLIDSGLYCSQVRTSVRTVFTGTRMRLQLETGLVLTETSLT